MIGVFDSGHGGLTILHALVRRLPHQHFLYLGDHAHAPYGTRPVEEIYALTVGNVDHLLRMGCRLVILACNTASAVSLRRLQQTWLPHAYPDRRVLGVLVPTVEAITEVPWTARAPRPDGAGRPRLAVIFATPRTVASGAYVTEIALRAPHVTVEQQACPGLVDLIEADAPGAQIQDLVERFIAEALDRLGGRIPDAAILGCTHYPLVRHHFQAALPASVEILSQPDLVAESLQRYLLRRPAFADWAAVASPVFATTGCPERVSCLASRFIGRPTTFTRLLPVPV